MKNQQAMQNLYDTDAPKKRTNLSINSDLLLKSRSLRINLSTALEEALKQQLELAQEEAKKWAEKNKTAIKAYNTVVQGNGCFGDDFRSF